MACMLSARGKRFDVDGFLRGSSLVPHKLWKKGEAVSESGPRTGNLQQYSGFNLVVSEHGRDALGEQQRDAERFLRKYQAELKRLRAATGLEDLWLEFGVLWREDVAIHTDCVSPGVVEAAGLVPLSLSISHYRV